MYLHEHGQTDEANNVLQHIVRLDPQFAKETGLSASLREEL